MQYGQTVPGAMSSVALAGQLGRAVVFLLRAAHHTQRSGSGWACYRRPCEKRNKAAQQHQESVVSSESRGAIWARMGGGEHGLRWAIKKMCECAKLFSCAAHKSLCFLLYVPQCFHSQRNASRHSPRANGVFFVRQFVFVCDCPPCKMR